MKLEYKIVPTCLSCVYHVSHKTFRYFGTCERFNRPVSVNGICIYYAESRNQGHSVVSDWFEYVRNRIVFPEWEDGEVRQ